MIKKSFQMAKIITITAYFLVTVGLIITTTIAHSGEEEKNAETYFRAGRNSLMKTNAIKR